MALGTPTLLDTFASDVSTSSVISGSISPTGGALLIAIIATIDTNTNDVTAVDDTLTGTGDWTQRAELETSIKNFNRIEIWTATAGSTPGSGTVTATLDNAVNRRTMSIIEITGHDTTSPIVQSKTYGSDSNSDPDHSYTLDSSPDSSNCVLAGWLVHTTVGATVAPGTNYTELTEYNISATPDLDHEVMYDTSPTSTTVDMSISGTETLSRDRVGAAIEIAAASADVTVTPSAVSAIASSVAPTVVLGSTTATPAAISCIASSVDPTVIEGDITITPTPASCIASSVAPTVVLGSTTAAPSAISCIASSVAPTVVLGSLSLSPGSISAIASSSGPTVDISGGVLVTIDFEEGDLSDFDSTTGGEDLAANGSAAMVGSYGMELTCNDTNNHYGVKAFTIDTDDIRFRFYFDPNNISMSSGDAHAQTRIQCDGTYSSITELCTVRFRENSGNYQVQLRVVDDNNNDDYTTFTNISDNEHYIEVHLKRETGDGNNDGTAKIYIDGVETGGSLSDVDNYNIFQTVSEVRFGITTGLDSGTTGSMYFDDLIIRNDDTEIGSAEGDINITPAARNAIASSSGPTVVLGSTSVTPTPASAIASSVDPTVIGGDVTVSPSPVSCIVSSVAPTVVLGSVSITPSAINCIASSSGPTVLEGGAILTIDFEEGDLSDFDSTTNGEDLAANNASVLVGAYGMQVTCDDTSVHYGFNSLSISTGEVRSRFYLDPNSLTMAGGDDLDICRIQCDGTYSGIDELCTVIMRYYSGSFQVRLNVEPDNGIDRQTTWENISDNSHYIEVLMTTESSDGAADGVARIYVDGVETSGSITDLENYNVFLTIDGVRLGIAYGQESGTTGSFYMDDLIVRDDTTEIGPAQSSLTYAPGAISAIASKVDPSVIQSSISYTPGAVSCIASTVDPTVAIGSVTVTPFAVSCIVSSIDPTVIAGDITLSPGSVSSIASSSGPSAVVLGSISITPTPDYAIASVAGPTVHISDLDVSPSPVSAIAQVGGLAVDVNGDLYCLPYSAVTVASTVDPTVLEIPQTIVDLTLTDRDYTWQLFERSGFFVVFNVLFEDGVIMEFEDGDEVTWGGSRSGYSLPARDLDFTLDETRED